MRPDQFARPEVGLIQERLIGRVLVEWNKLEACMVELLWRFLGLNFEDGRLITERMDPARLIVLLRAMAPRKLQGSQLQLVIDLLEIADRMRDDRNFIVHGSWATIEPEGVAVSASLRTKSEPGEVISEHFPHSRLRSIAQQIIFTKRQLFQICETFPGPSPYK